MESNLRAAEMESYSGPRTILLGCLVCKVAEERHAASAIPPLHFRIAKWVARSNVKRVGVEVKVERSGARSASKTEPIVPSKKFAPGASFSGYITGASFAAATAMEPMERTSEHVLKLMPRPHAWGILRMGLSVGGVIIHKGQIWSTAQSKAKSSAHVVCRNPARVEPNGSVLRLSSRSQLPHVAATKGSPPVAISVLVTCILR
eukprot:scaffold63821_cov41-Tisochrysis_lutea.AAC.2